MSKANVQKLWVFGFVCGMLASCGNSPQTASDQTRDGDEQPYTLQYSDVMEFTRGINQSYEVVGSFAGENDAQLTIDGLPAGATFTAGQLTWQPSCALKPENGQFLRGYMVHRLRLNLLSLATDSLVQRPAIILVHMHGEGSVCED